MQTINTTTTSLRPIADGAGPQVLVKAMRYSDFPGGVKYYSTLQVRSNPLSEDDIERVNTRMLTGPIHSSAFV
jgi:hypothetical protein